MNLSTTPASSKVEAQVHQPSILNPNNCPSASLHRHPHHAWLKHRGADSYIGETKIQEEPHLCETSGSGELRPHKSLVGVGVNASKMESDGAAPVSSSPPGNTHLEELRPNLHCRAKRRGLSTHPGPRGPPEAWGTGAPAGRSTKSVVGVVNHSRVAECTRLSPEGEYSGAS